MQEQQSAEKFNIWNHKPWWCQPWSIILTGITIIASSWFLLHLMWLSTMIALPIIAWWVYFLILYPRAIAAMYQTETDN